MLNQLPRVPTAELKRAGYGRKGGEQVAHEVVGDCVTLTFLSANFFGGMSCRTITRKEFKRDFAIIGARRARR